MRRSSPGRLQLILAVLVVLGVLTGLVAGLTGASARSGTAGLGDRQQPLMIQAETIYSALADADTTAAQAFLAGGLEPAALTRRYDDDLDRAGAALTTAAGLAPSGGKAAGTLAGLSAGVSQYAALVATARADNRQGLPVGSSYLSAASELNRNTLLAQAGQLFEDAQAEVNDGYDAARSIAWWSVLVILLVGLLVALVSAQRYLSRTTRRTFNVPLVAATALTVLLALAGAGVLISETGHLSKASDQGSAPVARLAEARILALRERGDEALALAAHGSGSSSETDFQAAQKALTGDRLLVDSPSAADANAKYQVAHTKVRALDDGGDYDGAVRLAVSPATNSAFDTFTTAINNDLELHKATFADEIRDAGHGLTLMAVLGPLVALVVCALAVLGIRARLEEYR
jgi:hypothetical protein